MTLGQQIQSLRKEKGLSQEALGETLGVSRQAVSQWESDGSTPELDKLVALSRLFGVSLGWLLQVEERGGEDPPDPAGLEALRAERDRLARSRRRGHWLSALAAVLAVAAIGLLWARLDRAETRLAALEAGVQAPAAEGTAPAGPAMDILWERGDVLADCGARIKDVDFSTGTLTLDLSVRPAQVDGDTAVSFLLEGEGDPVTVPGSSGDGLTYTASEVKVPLASSLTVSVLLEDDSGLRVQPACRWPDLLGYYMPRLDAAYEGTCLFREGDEVLEAEGLVLLGLNLDSSSLQAEQYTPVLVTVGLAYGDVAQSGGEVPSIEPKYVPLGRVSWEGPFDDALEIPISMEEPLAPGERAQIWVHATWAWHRAWGGDSVSMIDCVASVQRDEDGTVHYLDPPRL